MTEHEYRSRPAISRSELWKIRESPEKFKYYQEHPEAPTPALIFGQVFHKLALEPGGFDDEFAVAPNIDRRTKEGKTAWSEFMDANTGKTIIDADTYGKVIEMVEAICKVPMAVKLLVGHHELPLFWEDDLTGELCKVRLDVLTEIDGQPVIVDLKTTNNASTDSFIHSAIKYGYDFQAAMYSEGVKQNLGKTPQFIFVAVEKEPPYAVNVFQADDEFLQHGYDVFRELIGTYHFCKTTDNWYGYLGAFDEPNELYLPGYLSTAKQIEEE